MQQEKINLKELSVKQQLGLYVVLKKLYNKNNRHFYSSDFAKVMRPFLTIDNLDEYRKTIGGILGSLSKNKILQKESSDRDPLWSLSENIHSDPDFYRDQLQHIPKVKISWEK